MSINSKRFKTLENAFNLPSIDGDGNDVDSKPLEEVQKALKNAKKIQKKFSKLDPYSVHDNEMDELSKLAVDAHKDLQELGMNVEIRHAGEIFSSSSQMLKIAVDAKNNKVEKNLKLLRLQLIKMKLDLEYKDDQENTVDGVATKLDRNELLNQLKQINEEDNEK
jgi:hypothetical protein